MMHKILAAFLALFLLQVVCLAKDPPQVTDDTINDAVRVKLASDQVVGVLRFQVDVKSGVVTLAGSVRSEESEIQSREGRQEGEGREAGGQQHRDQDRELRANDRLRAPCLWRSLAAAGARAGLADLKFERLAQGYRFTAGPAWSKEGGYLIFSDTPSDRLLKWVPGERDRGLPHGCARSRAAMPSTRRAGCTPAKPAHGA